MSSTIQPFWLPRLATLKCQPLTLHCCNLSQLGLVGILFRLTWLQTKARTDTGAIAIPTRDLFGKNWG